MPLTSCFVRRALVAPALVLIAAASQADVNSLAVSTLLLQVGNMRKGVGNPADGRPLTVAGTTIRTSVEDDLRVNGADFDFRLAGGNAEGGVTLGRPYASAFSHVNGWPTPQAGASLMADAQGLARVNYGGTVTGAAGQAGTVTIRGRFGEVAVGAASGLVASSGTVEELVSVGVSTPGQLRCALPPCFDSERLYAELIGSGSALISVEYGYELSVAVQAGDRLDLWLWAFARSVNGYSVFVGPVPALGSGAVLHAMAADSAPPLADWQMSLSFSDGLGLSAGSGLVAGPDGWALPLSAVPEAPTWALWLAALAVLPRLTRRRRAS